MLWQKLILTILFPRKHAMQLQFPRQNGHASSIASSDIVGYLYSVEQRINSNNNIHPQEVKRASNSTMRPKNFKKTFKQKKLK